MLSSSLEERVYERSYNLRRYFRITIVHPIEVSDYGKRNCFALRARQTYIVDNT
jgi:hypothetical protein